MTDDRPPGLAVLVKRFPRLSETFVLNEFLELRRQGVRVRLFAILDPQEPQAQPEAATLRGEVVYLRARPWWALVSVMVGVIRRHPAGALRALRLALARRSRATWRHLGEALVLVDHLDRENLVHLHAHFAHGPAAIAHLAHLVCDVPYSFTAHAKDLYTTPTSYVALRSDAARFVVTCTAANAGYLRDVVGADASKVVVCRHGVDLERFRTVARSPQPGRILSVGRLVPKKGFDTLIRACAVLASRGVEFQCAIVGDGPLRHELVGLIRSLDLEDRVRIEPARPQPALVREYEQAAVFALPCVVLDDGDRDGIPNVILEAMAAGVPVAATAVSGIPEVVVDGETGRLVAPGDASALAEVLVSLLDDTKESTRLATSARRHAALAFDLCSAVGPLVDAFSACLDTGAQVEVPA
jgi:glycosyltransferase involved in cell wall biosynthesis